MSQLAERRQEQPVSAQEAKDKVVENGSELRTQATSKAREEVDARSTQLAEQLQSMAQTMRRTASELRAQGQQGQSGVVDQVALRAEQFAGYLSDADPDQLVEDGRRYGGQVVSVARRQPLLIVPLGLFLGILGGRALQARSQA
jgi:hypothetical protein